ncbi:MAG: cytochrome P450 [Pseudomonadota bacterium]
MDAFDPTNLSAEFYEDPYPTYARLREQNPVYPLPDGGFFLTRYADVDAVYRNPKVFSSDKTIQFAPVLSEYPNLYMHHTTSLVFNDPPLHTRVRRAIGNSLSQRMIQRMRGELVALIDDLIDELPHAEPVDLIESFAARIPVEVIGNLLGVPADEREPLRAWSLAILGCLEPAPDTQTLLRGEQATLEFLAYLEHFVSQHRLTNDDDIISRLLTWVDDDGGLAASQLYHQCIFLLNAGHETTTNLIGNGIELLAAHAEQRAKFLNDDSIHAGAIEEILRYESSNQLGNRTARVEVKLAGCVIPADSVVTLCIGAANRDPEMFVDPDRFDVARTPIPHLGFGAGIHTCAGLHVARLEGQLALGRFFQAFQEVSIVSAQRSPRARFRGFSRLIAQLR